MITRENGDTLFAVKTHAGMCGTDAIDGVWAKDAEEACVLMQDWAREWYDNFNHDEEEDFEPEVELWAEPWDDEVHPSEWPGGAKYSNEFAED